MKFSLFSVDTSKSQTSANVRTGRDIRPPYPPEASTSEVGQSIAAFRALSERMSRAMDAATVDNFTQDLRGSYGDANTELYPYNYTVRARSRTLAKNTSHGKGTMRVYADNVVGDDPFELEMKIVKRDDDGKPILDPDTDEPQEDKEIAEAICEAWGIFRWQENFTIRKNMDFMEALRVAEMARKRDGMVICRMYPRYPYNDFGFAVDFLERDHLQEQWSGFSPTDGMYGAGNPIVGSIEQHPKYKFALAYWLLRRHPGNAYAITASVDETRNFREQVPAEEVILMDNPRTRPEQDTGDTEFDAALLALWRIHQYEKSLTLTSILCASRPWWIEEDRATGMEMPGYAAQLLQNFQLNAMDQGIPQAGPNQDPAASQNNDSPKKQLVKPGSREELPAGKKLKWADAKFPVEAASTFRKDNERDLATGTHGSYAQMSGDYQNLGFVAGLMSQIPFQRNIRVNQKTTVEDLRPMFRMWLKSTILKGYFEKKGVFVSITRLEEFVAGAYFKGQQAEFVNPLLQAQTLILLNEAGHLTDQQVQDALPNGVTTNKLYNIRKSEQEQKLNLGLMAPSAVAAMPSIAHEGTTAPGENRPTTPGVDPNSPTPAGTKPGGPADAPPKKKVQRPGVNRSRIAGQIDDTTRLLLEMSQNGHD